MKSDTLLQSLSAAVFLTLVARLFTFGRGVLLARLLDPAELGVWALLINTVQVLAFVLLLGVPTAMSRYVGKFESRRRLARFLSGWAIRIALVAILFAIVTLFWQEDVGQLLFGESVSSELFVLAIVATGATIVMLFLQGVLHGLRLFRLDSCLDLFHNIGFFVLACVFLLAWRTDAFACGTAHIAITLVAAVAIGWFVHRAMRSDDNEDKTHAESEQPSPPTKSKANAVWWTVLLFSLGTWTAGSLQSLWRYIDRYMLLHLSGDESDTVLAQIGEYFIAAKLCQPMTAIVGMAAVVLVPHMAKAWEEGRRKEVGQTICFSSKLGAIFLALTGAGLLLCKPLLLVLIAGRMPHDASLVMAPVVVTMGLVCLHYILRPYLFCSEQAWGIAIIWAVVLAANFALNWWLIPQWGLYGAAVATMISAIVAAAATTAMAIWQGLRPDAGFWLSLPLPLLLLFSPIIYLPALVLWIALAVGTSLIFTTKEKQTLIDKARGLLDRVAPAARLRSISRRNKEGSNVAT